MGLMIYNSLSNKLEEFKPHDNKKVNMPIINLIYNIIFNDYDPHKLLQFLIEK